MGFRVQGLWVRVWVSDFRVMGYGGRVFASGFSSGFLVLGPSSS